MNRRGAVRAVLVAIVALNAVIVVVALSRSDEAARVEPTRVSVTVLDTGTEPHGVLRFSAHAGSTMRTTLEIDGQSTGRTPGQRPVVIPMPRLELDLASRVTKIETDARSGTEHITVELTATDVRLDDTDLLEVGAVADFDREMQPLIDDTLETLVVDPRGVIVRGSVASTPEPQAQLGVVPASYAPGELYPFPAEAVGIGARWRTRSQFSDGEIYGYPLTWNVVVHLELVELHDDRAIAHVDYEASLAIGPDRPTMQGIELTSMTQTFTGSVIWFFDHPGALLSGEGTTFGQMFTDLDGRQAQVDFEQQSQYSETRLD